MCDLVPHEEPNEDWRDIVGAKLAAWLQERFPKFRVVTGQQSEQWPVGFERIIRVYLPEPVMVRLVTIVCFSWGIKVTPGHTYEYADPRLFENIADEALNQLALRAVVDVYRQRG